METNSQTTIKAELTLEERLAAIAEAMKNKGDIRQAPEVKVACPVDPAERALCEGCQ